MKNPLKLAILALIRLYQKTLSPDTGWFSSFFPHGYCRFHPTCSEYTYQSIEAQGIIKGALLGMWRIIRCNPFSKGGIDLAPKKRKTTYSITHHA